MSGIQQQSSCKSNTIYDAASKQPKLYRHMKILPSVVIVVGEREIVTRMSHCFTADALLVDCIVRT